MVPDGLKPSGEALWVEVTKARTVGAAHRTVLLNACRIADRLDDIAAELEQSPLTVTIFDSRGNPVNEVAQPLLGEFRQQFATLSMILGRLGVKELPRAQSGASARERLAEARKAREGAEQSTA